MRKRSKVKENSPDQWTIPPLHRSDNKYTRGHVLILGGDTMTGAARLSALAAQRAGAGLVTIAAPKDAFAVYASSMLSVMVRASEAWAELVADKRIDPVLIGPGAGVTPATKTAMRATAKAGKMLILDADALTLLARDAGLRTALLKSPKILTPHEGEYARLATALKLEATDRLAQAQALATAMNAVVVLKGATTLIADGTHLLTSDGPPWLATGGTGDVLAGIIAALVGQGMRLLDAGAAGVWLHSEAARMHGPGMIAEDVIGSVPEMLRKLSA